MRVGVGIPARAASGTSDRERPKKNPEMHHCCNGWDNKQVYVADKIGPTMPKGLMCPQQTRFY